MYRFYLLIALTLVLACQSKTPKENIHTTIDSSLYFIDGVSFEKSKIDSFKWILYAANFGNNVWYEEDRKPRPKLYPEQCNFLFWGKIDEGKDSSEYYFSVYYKDPKVFYDFYPEGYAGVGTINNEISYLLGSHYFKTANSPEVSKRFFIQQDTSFRNHLKTYKGEISDWLRQEAIKRGVIGN